MKTKNLNTKKYYNYQELTDFLQKMTEKFPDYLSLESLGRTNEKREMWFVTLTNTATGDARNKPAVWIDGNIHASEISGAQSCLYFIDRILTDKSSKSELQFLLDHVTFYILPQVSPDGAAFFLNNNYEIRSIPQLWPEVPVNENIDIQDINKDGEVLLMRKLDPAGGYKCSKTNPEIMTRRLPRDLPLKSEKYYSLYPEGLFKNYDGINKSHSMPQGLDLNRQFPMNFKPQGEQTGAGSYPMMVKEIQNFVKAFVARPRIFAHIALHTYGGLVLRPPGGYPEEHYHLQDMDILKKLTESAADVSGYPALCTGTDFKYYSRSFEAGTADDWSFDQRGVYSITIEIWDIWKAAGVTVKDHVSRYFKPLENDLLKIFAWAKKNLGLKSFYVGWKKYNHPQLGPVEIGGWKTGFLFRNPPEKFLEQEMKKVFAIIIEMAKSAPILKITESVVKKIDQNTYKVSLIVCNQGYLPTYGSHQAIKVAAVKKPLVQIKTSKALKLISGKNHFETEHLTGVNRFFPFHSAMIAFASKNSNEQRFEFFFQGSGTAFFEFDYERGGVLKTEIQI